MKILVVGDYQKGSGLTNYIINTYNEFPDTIEIDCLSYSNAENMIGDIKKRGWKFFNVTPITKNPFKHVLEWKKFLKENAKEYDIVHFNYSAAWNYFAIKFAKKYGIKNIIVHSHNNYYSKTPENKITHFVLDLFNNRGKKVIEKNANLKIAVSKDASNWMFNNLKEVKFQKNGINIQKFKYSENFRREKRDNSFEENDILIGFVGVLEDRKNPFFALNIFSELHKKNKKNKLLLFGQGPDKDALISEVEKLGLESAVLFMGVVDDLNKWYSALDFFIFPSKTEGFGFVLLEAQVSGIKTITSDQIPTEAIVTDSVFQKSLKDPTIWVNWFINENTKEYRENRLKISQENINKIKNEKFSITDTAKELLDEEMKLLR